MTLAAKLPGPDDATEILRRVEPMLHQILAEQQRMAAEQQRLAAEQQRMAAELQRLAAEQQRMAQDLAKLERLPIEVARIDGRVTQLPTVWTMTMMIVGIFGLSLLLVRLAQA